MKFFSVCISLLSLVALLSVTGYTLHGDHYSGHGAEAVSYSVVTQHGEQHANDHGYGQHQQHHHNDHEYRQHHQHHHNDHQHHQHQHNQKHDESYYTQHEVKHYGHDGNNDNHHHDHQEHYDHAEHNDQHDDDTMYKFKYGVKDFKTGDVKQQWEHRDGDTVKGAYAFKDADGTTRVVKYTADNKNGFQATVHKIGHAHNMEQRNHNGKH